MRYILIGLLVAVFAVSQAQASLQLHWAMDEKILIYSDFYYVPDESGNGNLGYIFTWADGGNPQLTTDAMSGNALDFNGVNDYVQQNNSTLANLLTTGSVTISAWMKTDSLATTQAAVSTLAWDGIDIGINGVSGAPRCYYANSTWTYYIAGPPVLANEWYNIAMTYVGGTGPTGPEGPFILYLNGIKVAQTSMYQGAMGGNGPYRLAAGKYSYGGSYFNGIIDEVKVYDDALSHEDILDNYLTMMFEKEYDDGYRDGLLSTDPVGEILDVLPPGIAKNLLDDRGFAK